MTAKVIWSALLTGGFCAVFAVGIDAIMTAFSTVQIALIALTSGFLGRLFAHLVPDRRQVR